MCEEIKDFPIYVSKFEEEDAKTFFNSFQKAKELQLPIVPVVINSYGGNIDTLFAMIDIIKSYPGKVATFGIGTVMSSGAILLSFGTYGMRYLSPNARVMMHSISAGAWGKVCEVKVATKEAVRLQNHLYRLMAKQCKQPTSYFLNYFKDHQDLDIYMMPKIAKYHKIIDHISYPKINIKNKTSIEIK